jgi:hypothetical protein
MMMFLLVHVEVPGGYLTSVVRFTTLLYLVIITWFPLVELPLSLCIFVGVCWCVFL